MKWVLRIEKLRRDIIRSISMEILGIITARGGSKSIPRKNIRSFCGKPLMGWAVETLKESGVVSRVVLSTEDEEIAEIGKNFGAEVPFMRPQELAEDHMPTLPVLQHAVRWLKGFENYSPSCVVLLEPTAIGKRPFHIKETVDMFFDKGVDSVISVSEVPSVVNPHWQLRVDTEGRVELFTGGSLKDVIRRRQDLPKTYYRNSSIYVFKPHLLFSENPSFYGEDVRAYTISGKYAFDLDTPEDWIAAEARFKKILEDENESNPWL